MNIKKLVALILLAGGAVTEVTARVGGGGSRGGGGRSFNAGGRSVGGGRSMAGGRSFAGSGFSRGPSMGRSSSGVVRNSRAGGYSRQSYARPSFAGSRVTRPGYSQTVSRVGQGTIRPGGATRPVVRPETRPGAGGRPSFRPGDNSRPGLRPGGDRPGGFPDRPGNRPGSLNPNRVNRRDQFRTQGRLNQQRDFLRKDFRGHNWGYLWRNNWPLFISTFPFAYFNQYGSYPPVYYDYYDDYGSYPEQNQNFDQYMQGQIPIDYGMNPVEYNPQDEAVYAPLNQEVMVDYAGSDDQESSDDEQEVCRANCGFACFNDCISTGESTSACTTQCKANCAAECAATA